jgi:hypothetical protein
MKANDLVFGGNWKPSPQQELLLRAALWQGDDARAAWEQWSSQNDLRLLDLGSHRLLPLLYLNLLSLQIQHPWLPDLHNVYRSHWYRNQLKLRRAGKTVELLDAANIPTLLLKACALIPLYYRDPGARPMSDIDLLVPTLRAREALNLLHNAGWEPTMRPMQEMAEGYFQRLHAHGLRTKDWFDLDLHRHVFTYETRVDGDTELWAGAIPLNVQGTKTLALHPADQLLHICAHGVEWNLVSPVRWAADAYMVLSHAEIDWQRFLDHVSAYELVLVSRHLLQYLADTLGAPIPTHVLEALRQMPVTRREQILYELSVRPHSEHNTTLKLWYHYGQYRRVMHVYKNENWLLRFPAFLRDTWALPKTSDVPKYILRFATNWVARRVSPITKSLGTLTKDRA